MLHEFLTANREELVKRCRAKVATRSVPPPTAAEIDHGVPLFLDQLVAALRGGGTKQNTEITDSAVLHGRDLLLQGFTVSQVVHDYGDVCQSITDLAMELNAPISTDDFRTLNRCLDDAIAGAVTEFGRGRTSQGIEGEVARGSERSLQSRIGLSVFFLIERPVTAFALGPKPLTPARIFFQPVSGNVASAPMYVVL